MQALPPPGDPRPGEVRPRAPGRPRVLVVDDDDDIRLLLQVWLEGTFEVLTAPDGIAAIAMLREGVTFDVAVLDVMMPKVDGFAVARAIRDLRPGVPVVMLSAVADPANRARGVEAGVHTYYAKPFDPLQLKGTLIALSRGGRGRAARAAAVSGAVLPRPATVPLPPRPAAVPPPPGPAAGTLRARTRDRS